MRIEMAVVKTERQIVVAMTDVTGIALRIVSILCAIEIERLPRGLGVRPKFEFFRHPGRNIDYASYGVAGIGGRKWAVHDIDTFNFSRRYSIPAGRTGIYIIVAKQ